MIIIIILNLILSHCSLLFYNNNKNNRYRQCKVKNKAKIMINKIDK